VSSSRTRSAQATARANVPSERARLGEAQVVRVSRNSAANQARLPRNKCTVLLIAEANGFWSHHSTPSLIGALQAIFRPLIGAQSRNGTGDEGHAPIDGESANEDAADLPIRILEYMPVDHGVGYRLQANDLSAGATSAGETT